MKYRVRGTYEITLLIEVDTEVEAIDETDAIMIAGEETEIGQYHDMECKWGPGDPEVKEIPYTEGEELAFKLILDSNEKRNSLISNRGEDVGDVPW